MKNKTKLMAGTAAVIAAFMTLSAPAMAQSETRAQTAVADQGGLYLGAYGGYGWSDGDVAGGSNIDGTDWGLFAGYEMTGLFESFTHGINAAVEFHYGWSNADDAGAGTFVDKDNEWGVSFRPGLTFMTSDESAIKPYGILGYRRTEFDNNLAGTSDDYNGFELGVGTELIAFGDIGVRLDYTHVFYGDDGLLDPDEDDIRLGVAYHF